MLIRFGAKNYLSIYEYQQLTFVATKATDVTSPRVAMQQLGSNRILPAIILYGANASGKTNLLSAIRFMKWFVRESHVGTTEPEGIKRSYFRLARGGKEESSKLDCDMVIGGLRYHYGFEFNDQVVVSEWLYSFPDSRRHVLFYRKSAEPIYFGPSLEERAKTKLVEQIMRPNSLFLSAAAQNNVKVAAEICGWFEANLLIPDPNPDRVTAERLSASFDNEVLRTRIVNFIRSADPTITGVEVIEHPLTDDLKTFQAEFSAVFQKHFGEKLFARSDDTAKFYKEYRLQHASDVGINSFSLGAESRGTLKLLDLLGSIFKCLDTGGTIVCDELESNLHPIVAHSLIMLFNSHDSNKRGAQVLAATHDTNLLDLKCFRRDQIWFAEKSPIGQTHLYSLSELAIKSTDNLEQGYLQGRFGGIPFLPDVERLRSA